MSEDLRQEELDRESLLPRSCLLEVDVSGDDKIGKHWYDPRFKEVVEGLDDGGGGGGGGDGEVCDGTVPKPCASSDEWLSAARSDA